MPILKDVDKGGVAKIPSAYKLEEVTITNKIGQAVDLYPSVIEIKINESLFSPTTICQVIVQDQSNIIEIMPFYGLETMKIVITRKEGTEGSVERIEKLYYVTQFPNFMRPREEHTQVYQITGISLHSWKNPMMRISRYYSGLIIDQIPKIGLDFFGLKVLKEGISLNEGKGIINIQTPLQAIDWFRRRIHTTKGTPFYFFETIKNKDKEVNLISHDMLTAKPVYREYYDGRTFSVEESGLQEDYDQRKQRMIDVTSDLKLSKFVEAPKGSYASENNFLDIAKRTFTKKFYSYPANFPIADTINKTSILEPPPDFNPPAPTASGGGPAVPNLNMETIEEYFYTHQEHVSLNSESYFGILQNYNQWSHQKIDVLNAYQGVFNTLSHDVEVYGDFKLNPGKIVDLKFPKAMDVQLSGRGDLWDRNLSGKYMVTSCVHLFKGNEYFTNFRVKRDSFSI